MAKQKVLIIVGPTSSGKSALAVRLARKFNGEIISADSRQVYERLDIATNKPSPEQRSRIRYHMIDFVDPASTFNAAEYIDGARTAIEDIAGRGLVPIVEGGTMLYVDALCDGFSLAGVPPDDQLRGELAHLLSRAGVPQVNLLVVRGDCQDCQDCQERTIA